MDLGGGQHRQENQHDQSVPLNLSPRGFPANIQMGSTTTPTNPSHSDYVTPTNATIDYFSYKDGDDHIHLPEPSWHESSGSLDPNSFPYHGSIPPSDALQSNNMEHVNITSWGSHDPHTSTAQPIWGSYVDDQYTTSFDQYAQGGGEQLPFSDPLSGYQTTNALHLQSQEKFLDSDSRTSRTDTLAVPDRRKSQHVFFNYEDEAADEQNTRMVCHMPLCIAFSL